MIPQNLLLAFLSLQGQDQGRSGAPQSSHVDLNVFDSLSSTPANHQVKGFPEVEPVRVEEPDQQSPVSIEERTIHWFPFESFPVGSYDDGGLKYHDDKSGHVQITTNTTSHLWSLAESFPFIQPKHLLNKNVKGAYPSPAGITINFQKNWKEVHVTLGDLSYKGLVERLLRVEYRANKKLHREEFTIGEGWSTWIGKAPNGGPHEGIDHVNFFFGNAPHTGHAANRLVIESVTWS